MPMTRGCTTLESPVVLAASGVDPEVLATSSGSQTATAWRRGIEDLLAMRALPDDWDGLGAEAPPRDVIDSAIDLVRTRRNDPDAPPPVRIVSSPNGSVVLEWQMAGAYYEAEIAEPYHAEWMFEPPGGPAEHWEEDWTPLAGGRQEAQDMVWEPCYQVFGNGANTIGVA